MKDKRDWMLHLMKEVDKGITELYSGGGEGQWPSYDFGELREDIDELLSECGKEREDGIMNCDKSNEE